MRSKYHSFTMAWGGWIWLQRGRASIVMSQFTGVEAWFQQGSNITVSPWHEGEWIWLQRRRALIVMRVGPDEPVHRCWSLVPTRSKYHGLTTVRDRGRKGDNAAAQWYEPVRQAFTVFEADWIPKGIAVIGQSLNLSLIRIGYLLSLRPCDGVNWYFPPLTAGTSKSNQLWGKFS